ncbi:GcrA family cell cycle regulator [Streptomyces olivaceus]|uniref:helix-turn-helix domain-containing protein n=1 Tax=Streptomyces TaxID=1883 RepID=UPI001CCC8CD4|nr:MULTISPECIES: helix-turn-helix domain-containing protein [Streptomyces]MBZ6258836.1 GcrA family cell cycle regulator [Streptomyces olivaceus]MCM8548922.1 GcrA family cell cycle regulator [Streptomyces sp. STCH 565 A]
MSDEEVRRVSDALDAVDRIPDRVERVRARSRIMADQVKRNREWSKERSDLIRELWADGAGMSYREIAAYLDVKLSTVQDVFRGYTGSGTTRPKKAGE